MGAGQLYCDFALRVWISDNGRKPRLEWRLFYHVVTRDADRRDIFHYLDDLLKPIIHSRGTKGKAALFSLCLLPDERSASRPILEQRKAMAPEPVFLLPVHIER